MGSINKSAALERAVTVALAAAVCAVAPIAHAQTTQAAAAADHSDSLDEIVVTASGGDKTKLQSSISVSSVSLASIEEFTPRSEAEVLRTIPGLNLQDTAGPGGNSNIGVRGIPVSTGGSEYVALQEDGLPVTLFGDMQFGNNDYWLRFDSNVDRVEAVRGGSTATYTSQAPGAVINYISKTGETEGGAARISRGLGFDETRLDFDYGGHISDTLRYHVGGFFKDGQGPTDIGYQAERGYQFKANVTKEFNDGKGYFRLNVKHLDDQEPTFTSMPSLATLSGNTITGFSELPGVNPRHYSSAGIYNQNFQILNGQGALQTVPNSGIHPVATAFGGELHNEVNGILTIDDRFRWTTMSGTFANQWTGETLASGFVGSPLNGHTVGSLVYATGPNKGQVYASPYLNDGAQAYVTMKNMGNFVNDLSLLGKFDIAEGSKVVVKAGWFHMTQTINLDWRLNNALLSLNSTNNSVPLDAFSGANGTGTQLTAGGLTGFNNQWGGLGGRSYDLTYTDDAPSLDLDWKVGKVDLDASVRYDTVRGSGVSYGTTPGANLTATDALGSASLPTYNTSPVVTDQVNYSINYTSWSVGALYEVNNDTSAFVRASHGGRANADRMLYSGNFNADGSLTAGGSHNAVNFVDQQEVGVKNRGQVAGAAYNVEATIFGAQVTEHNYDFTHQYAVDTTFHSYGLETFGNVRYGAFLMDGSVVYTHSVDTQTNLTPTAMPRWTFRFSPTYNIGITYFGLTVNGQTSSPTCCGQNYDIPGNTYLNAFIKVRPYENVEVGLNVNNLLDTLGYRGTGSLAVTGLPNNQAIFDNSAVLGRTVTASLRYRF